PRSFRFAQPLLSRMPYPENRLPLSSDMSRTFLSDALAKGREYGGQCAKIGNLAKAGQIRWGVGMVQHPGQFMRNVDAPAAGLDGRQDVGFQRVSNHHAFVRPVAVPGENAGVGLGALVADDFHSVEKIAEPRLRQLALLVEKIA